MSITEFFSPPNRFRPAADDPNGRLALRAVAGPDGIVVLPWDDGRRGTRWYVLTHRDRIEQVREEIAAHAGITYTDYRGQLTPPEPGDPGDEAVAQVQGDRAMIRLDLIDTAARQKVARSLGRFLDLWAIRPPPSAPPVRAAAEILRDYRLALTAGRRHDAETALAELRAAGGLEIINLRFLDLEVVSRFEGPLAILSHPALSTLLQIRRPARVTDLIAQAVDQASLRHDRTTTPSLLRQRFDRLDSPLQQLVTSSGECRSASGALLLALRVAAAGGDVDALVARVSEVVELDQDTLSLLQALAQPPVRRATEEPVTATSASLGELLVRGEYDRVLQLAVVTPQTIETVDAALRAAQWLDSIEAGRIALEVLEAAPSEIQDAFLANRLRAPMVEALRELVQAEAPRPQVRNWNEFFENLWSTPDWTDAIDTAEHGAVEWPARPILRDRDAITALAGHVNRGATSGVVAFSRVVPYLIDWLDRVPDDARPAIVDVQEALIAHLALEDQTRAGLDLLGSFAADVIAAGLDVAHYEWVLEHLEERWQGARSPATITWAADLIEVVIDQPCPDRARRTTFVATLLQTSAEFFSRIPADMQDLMGRLARELNLERLLPTVREEVEIHGIPTREVRGVVIGLYSLTESALRRAHDYLTGRWPGLQVVTRADHVASDELVNLARTADLMVVATRSAKHAATGFISDHRPTRLPTRYARGKGSASLVREVEDWLTAVQI
jgi:hypothetical protein